MTITTMTITTMTLTTMTLTTMTVSRLSYDSDAMFLQRQGFVQDEDSDDDEPALVHKSCKGSDQDNDKRSS